MKSVLLLTFAFWLLVFQTNAFAQTNSTLRETKEYCKTIDAFVKRHKNPQLIYADISDYEQNSRSKWRRFASEKALEKFREKTETYKIAYNWRKNGKLVQSNFTLFSPSGDWAQYIYHYFRPDGTLAKVESDMRTFYDDMIVLQTLYFDNKGKMISKNIQYKDLTSRKPKRPSKEFLKDFAELKSGQDYFKKTGKLPFAQLIGR